MGRLNLPPIERKRVNKKVTDYTEWNKDLPTGWIFMPREIDRFKSMALDMDTVRQMTKDIGIRPKPLYSLADYIYAARLAGIEPRHFVDIAKAGVMSSPPSLTLLRAYLGACNNDPLLAMLALRAKLTPQELADLQQDGELTVQNLRAMIDIGS